jgi:hypothetical protein
MHLKSFTIKTKAKINQWFSIFKTFTSKFDNLFWIAKNMKGFLVFNYKSDKFVQIKSSPSF